MYLRLKIGNWIIRIRAQGFEPWDLYGTWASATTINWTDNNELLNYKSFDFYTTQQASSTSSSTVGVFVITSVLRKLEADGIYNTTSSILI